MRLLTFLAVFALPALARAQTDARAVLPPGPVAGWTLRSAPKVFAGDRLFDYMDGAAEIPRGYGCREQVSAKYQRGRNALEVAVFDMATAADAFGYYSARSFLERNPRSPDRTVALDHPARLTPSIGILTLWKGRFTVIVQPDVGKPDDATLLAFGRAVSARIHDRGAPPDLVARLPRGAVAGTARYVRGKAAFDGTIAFIPRDVFGAGRGAAFAAAEYIVDGAETTLAVGRYANAVAAEHGFGAYGQYLSSRHAPFGRGDSRGYVTVVPGTPGRLRGTGAVAQDTYLLVVFGARNAAAASKGLDMLERTFGRR